MIGAAIAAAVAMVVTSGANAVPLAAATNGAATVVSSPTSTPAAVTTSSGGEAASSERPAGLGVPILFTGQCDRSGCTITAAGVVADATLQPIACDASNGSEVRSKLAARYFAPGTMLDVYARGAAAGSFEVTADASSPKSCAFRATGRKRNVPTTVVSFVALLPEDPVRLQPVKFPSAAQTDAKEIAAKALAAAKVEASAHGVDLDMVRRFRVGKTTAIVVGADASGNHVVAIAEGSGRDPASWKVVWSQVARYDEPRLTVVDALDLGADGEPEVLLERDRPQGPEWILLRRAGGTWKP